MYSKDHKAKGSQGHAVLTEQSPWPSSLDTEHLPQATMQLAETDEPTPLFTPY